MISFIFPIYKQEHVLEKAINLLDQYLSKNLNVNYEILICNDGSPDNCPSIALELSKKIDTVKAIGYEKNRGRGYSIKYASMYASGSEILYMDCDLSQEKYFVYIKEILKCLEQHDVVVASRFLPESRTIRRWQRAIVSKIFRTLVRIFFHHFNVTDPDVGFKGFKSECLKNVNLVCNLNGPSWDLQFLVNANYDGYSIKEIPFNYTEDYERTTVNIFSAGLVEFLGLLYIKFTSIISKYIVF